MTRSSSFASLLLSSQQLNNLAELKYDEMTPIQAAALPLILAGEDLIAQAKTGSGKTAAFGIGLLEKIDRARFKTQGLIITPTRELAGQVSEELRRLARAFPNLKITTLTGGRSIHGQISALVQHPPHIAVGTPGRLLDHLQRGTLSLDHLQGLILDEADRMLEMGFAEEMAAIIHYAPQKRQTLLFSATFPDDIEHLSHSIQQSPHHIVIEEQARSTIEQTLSIVSPADLQSSVIDALYYYQPDSAILFCNTIEACRQLVEKLNDAGIEALALHGDLDQRDRDAILLQLDHQSIRILVATDVAARGLDIEDLALVINVDPPRDFATYTHRIGRTGRAGNRGKALTLATEKSAHRLSLWEDGRVIDSLEKISITNLPQRDTLSLSAPMGTLEINAGRRSKISAGDILGALTAKGGIPGSAVGKITRERNQSYVAIERPYLDQALHQLRRNPIKGIDCLVRPLN